MHSSELTRAPWVFSSFFSILTRLPGHGQLRICLRFVTTTSPTDERNAVQHFVIIQSLSMSTTGWSVAIGCAMKNSSGQTLFGLFGRRNNQENPRANRNHNFSLFAKTEFCFSLACYNVTLTLETNLRLKPPADRRQRSRWSNIDNVVASNDSNHYYLRRRDGFINQRTKKKMCPRRTSYAYYAHLSYPFIRI